MSQPWWEGAPVAQQPGPWMPQQQGGQQQGGQQQGGQPPAGQPPAGAIPWMPQQGAPPPTPGWQQQASPQQTSPQQHVPAGSPTPGAASGGPTATDPSAAAATGRRVPGLGLLVFVVVMAALAFVPFVLWPQWTDWAVASDDCVRAGGAWECAVNEGTRTQVLLPAVAVFAALCLARGAGVERGQGRAVGYLYAVLGLAVLAVSWSLATGGAA